MGLVAVLQQVAAVVVQVVPVAVAVLLHDVALLLQALADEGVDILEPALEFRVLLSVAVDGLERVEEVIQRRAVGEALKQDLGMLVHEDEQKESKGTYPKVGLDRSHAVVAADVLDRTSSLLGQVLGVTSILLRKVQQGLNSSLV